MKKSRRILSVLLMMCILLPSIGVGASAATTVTPTVTLSSISNQSMNATVTVRGSATTPCYRMSAKYVHNGTTTWLGNVYSNTYSKSFKVTSAGTYTVTLYARSYPESDPRSSSGSRSRTFTVYNPVKPTVTLKEIANTTVGRTVTVSAKATTPCYRMSAKYVHNGATTWLGEVMDSSYFKSFTVQDEGTYTVYAYARSYPESDPRSASGSSSTTFTVTVPTFSLYVPLYGQPDGSTCGPTSVSMVLKRSGVSKSADDVKYYIIKSLSGDYTDWKKLAEALNDFLGDQSPGYVDYRFENSRSAAEHYNLVKKNLDAGIPIIPLLGFPADSANGFPYPSDGHYVVIKGYKGNSLIINDPYNGPANLGKEDNCAVREISNDRMKQYLEGDNPIIICAKQ